MSKTQRIAFIREAECIGCTKCIQACPVDAIVGAAQMMHTVIKDLCIGCDLCVPPCPVDCIDMLEVEDTSTKEQQKEKSKAAKQRFQSRKIRLAKIQELEALERRARLEALGHNINPVQDAINKVKSASAEKSPEEQREKLQRNVSAAKERVEHAEAKAADTRNHTPEQIIKFKARVEDLKIKLQQSELRLKEFELLQKAARLRSGRADEERVQDAVIKIESKLQAMKEELAMAKMDGTNTEELEKRIKTWEQKLIDAREEVVNFKN